VPTQPSLLLADGLLYMFADGGAATCLDAETGEEVWSERLSGHYSASPIYAAGRIYIGNEEGEMTVMAATDEPEVLAVNRLDGAFRASPAVAGRALYLRTDTHLYRIEDR
jgi:outer membrane protein assembly factor BamB